MPKEPPNESVEVLREQRRKLATGLERALDEIRRLETEKAELVQELQTDQDTGLHNRRFFTEKFSGLVEQAHQDKEPLALMLADVDGLKRTNDEMGHPAGDELIVAVANAMQVIARKTDLTGRLAGDEFYNIMPGFTPTPGQSTDQLINEIIARYEEAFAQIASKLGLPEGIRAGASFSIAILDVENRQDSAESLFNRADSLLLKIKKRKKEEKIASGQAYEDDRM